jgi:hypothetical protein
MSTLAEFSNILAFPMGILLSYTISDGAKIDWPGIIWFICAIYAFLGLVSHNFASDTTTG